jgi:hypothetical protein
LFQAATGVTGWRLYASPAAIRYTSPSEWAVRTEWLGVAALMNMPEGALAGSILAAATPVGVWICLGEEHAFLAKRHVARIDDVARRDDASVGRDATRLAMRDRARAGSLEHKAAAARNGSR